MVVANRTQRRRNGHQRPLALPVVDSRYEIKEVLAPARGQDIHTVGDSASIGRPTDSAKLVMGLMTDGTKKVFITFPKAGVCSPLSVEDLKKWRDGCQTMLDHLGEV